MAETKRASTGNISYDVEGEQESGKLQEIKDLQKKLKETLDTRPLLDPVYLAAAQAFLTPARTGSFFESLGTAGSAIAQAQQAQQQRAQEIAQMKLELAKSELGEMQSARGQALYEQALKRRFGGGQAAAPTTGGAAAGAATGVTPAGGGAPTGAPTAVAGGYQPLVTPEEYIAISKTRPDRAKELREAEDFAIKQQQALLDQISTQPGYIVNKLTKEVTPIVSPGQPDVDIRFPEAMEGKPGQVFKGSVEDAIALRNARNANDYAKIVQIYNKLAYGVPSPEAAKTGQPPARASSVQESELNVQRQKELASEFAKSEAKATSALLDSDSYNRETAYTSARVIQNASKNPQLFGVLRDPGIGNSLASFIKDRGEQGQYAITKENLQDFLIKSNFDTTKLDMVKLANMASDLARMHYGIRKAYFSGTGQGAVSDREDMGIAKIAGSVSDPAAALIYTAQLVGRRAQFDVDVANALRKERMDKGKNYTLEDFRTDPRSSYKKLLTEYENWLTKQFNLPTGITPETRKSPFSDTQVIPPR